MSEQAKIAFLQERIKAAHNRARFSNIGGLVSVALSAVFLRLYYDFGGWDNLIIGICFMIAMVLAFLEARNAKRIENELIRELHGLSVMTQSS